MGEGKATAGLGCQGLSGEPNTPPLPPPPLAPGHCGSGASGCLAGSPSGITQQGAGWLLGQPWVAKPQQCPRPAKGQPQALREKAGQGQVMRVGGVAKMPPPLVAKLPLPLVAGPP